MTRIATSAPAALLVLLAALAVVSLSSSSSCVVVGVAAQGQGGAGGGGIFKWWPRGRPTTTPPSSPPTPGEEGPDVIVVGAGVAGLNAARLLASAGRRVVVLEARVDRVGGRTCTNTELGYPVDLGASWVHGQQGNPLRHYLDSIGVELVVTDYEERFPHFDVDGSRVPDAVTAASEAAYEAVMAGVEARRDAMRARDPDVGVGTAVNQLSKEKGEQEAWSAQMQRSVAFNLAMEIDEEYGVDADDLSLRHFWTEQYFEGDDAVPRAGYTALVESLAKGIDVRLGCKVTSVTRVSTERVAVVCGQQSFSAKRVLITVPLGVLKADTIRFRPSVSAAKTTAVQRLAMAALNKVVLEFDEAFWPADADALGQYQELDQTPGQVSLIICLQRVSPERKALVFLVHGAASPRLSDKTDDEVAAEFMERVRRLFPTQAQAIKGPRRVLVTRWHDDPLSRGSYSFVPVGAAMSDFDAVGRPEWGGLLRFAGEATSSLHQSTVHAAFMSGQREAEAILSSSG